MFQSEKLESHVLLILVELNFFFPDNNVTNIDCSFEDGNDFPTICQWNSTREFNPFFFLPRGEFDLFHWQPVNEVSQFDESDHGPNEEHLEGAIRISDYELFF